MADLYNHRKGLGDIRTACASRGRADAPHKIHMRLVTLEMERARKLQERSSLTKRVGSLDDRLRAIDQETRGLRAMLDAQLGAATRETGGDQTASHPEPTPRVRTRRVTPASGELGPAASGDGAPRLSRIRHRY
jgi:hypothetical protein